MKFVLDSSVALKWVLPEPETDRALALLDKGHQFIAPDTFPVEVGHSLSKGVRQKKFTPEEAGYNFVALLDSRPALIASIRLATRSFEISLQTRCTYYDALYVALAEQEQCELITADKRLVANVSAAFPFVRSLTDV